MYSESAELYDLIYASFKNYEGRPTASSTCCRAFGPG